jgi:hypothetical protein
MVGRRERDKLGPKISRSPIWRGGRRVSVPAAPDRDGGCRKARTRIFDGEPNPQELNPLAVSSSARRARGSDSGAGARTTPKWGCTMPGR